MRREQGNRLIESRSKAEATTPSRTRLHISPFDPAILEKVIAPSVLASASNISYHSVQTFPEKSYGYIDLPTMEAQRLKKKLNGSILKGSKLRVEDARPERWRVTEEDDDRSKKPEKRRGGKSKEAKSEDGVLAGFQLPPDRRVKRGWTEPVSPTQPMKRPKEKAKVNEKETRKEKKAMTSKYTEKPELLFRTKLPRNSTINAIEEKNDKKKRKQKRDSVTVVHEFSNGTKHPSFLKESQSSQTLKPVSEYVDGVGWVDGEGKVVEAVPKLRRKGSHGVAKTSPAKAHEQSKERTDSDGKFALVDRRRDRQTKKAESPSVTKTARSQPGKESFVRGVEPKPSDHLDHLTDTEDESDDEDEEMEDASSEVSSDTSSASELDDTEKQKQSSPTPQTKGQSSSPSKSIRRVSFANAEADAEASEKSETYEPQPSKEVHPLEAIFKRPKSSASDRAANLAPIDTSFAFFGADGEREDADGGTAVPQTPFTRRDLQHRRMRSPAPAPDTAIRQHAPAAPWESSDYFGGFDEDEEHSIEASGEHLDDNSGELPSHNQSSEKDDSEDAVAEDPMQSATAAQGKNTKGPGTETESEFAKWFWENRGELNRAWKKRRREALKQKRQRENRRFGRRVL